MNDLGKMMVVMGALLIVTGVIICSGIGRQWLGRLPGDINYTRGNFSVHFPIVTCILVSVVLSLIFWIFRR